MLSGKNPLFPQAPLERYYGDIKKILPSSDSYQCRRSLFTLSLRDNLDFGEYSRAVSSVLEGEVPDDISIQATCTHYREFPNNQLAKLLRIFLLFGTKNILSYCRELHKQRSDTLELHPAVFAAAIGDLGSLLRQDTLEQKVMDEALAYAIGQSHALIIQILLFAGADPHAINPDTRHSALDTFPSYNDDWFIMMNIILKGRYVYEEERSRMASSSE